jgi:predicted ferric reductase
MILLLVLTFYVKLPYKVWKVSHKFLGLSYFFATLHLIFVYSDTNQSLVLKAYMLTVSFLALSAVFYRTVAGAVLVPICRYRVAAVNRINGAVFEIIMKPEKGTMHYNPGQFIFISFDQPGFTEKHPFTISSASGDLSIAVKSLGDYTARLGELKTGTPALIEGPYGKFSHHHSKNKKQVWLAGGIGITPFLSMARSLGESSEFDIDLIYCAKNAGEAVFFDELQQLSATRAWFRVHSFYSDEQGRISADTISKLEGGLKGRDYFLCGPRPMMHSIKKQLTDYDIPDVLIHIEEFAML